MDLNVWFSFDQPFMFIELNNKKNINRKLNNISDKYLTANEPFTQRMNANLQFRKKNPQSKWKFLMEFPLIT